MSDPSAILFAILGALPTALVLLGGLGACLLWWNRAPRAALMAASALSLLLLQAVFFQVAVRVFFVQGGSYAQWWWVVAGVQSLVHGLALALLVAAVFVGRPASGD